MPAPFFFTNGDVRIVLVEEPLPPCYKFPHWGWEPDGYNFNGPHREWFTTGILRRAIDGTPYYQEQASVR